MSLFLKNLLIASLIITLVSVVIFGYKFTNSYDKVSSPTNFRSFTVQGEGKENGNPNIASFSFDVISEGGNDVAALQNQNASTMNQALSFVSKEGIDKKDITTSQYSIQPRYEISNCNYGSGKPCPPATIVGYTIQQSVNVKVRDFKHISPLLSGVVKNGANTVSALQFTIDNTDELEKSARSKAIKQAQEKAEDIAEAGGFKLGRLLEIQENYSSPYGNPLTMRTMADASESSPIAPNIEAGSQEIKIGVTLKYEIE